MTAGMWIAAALVGWCVAALAVAFGVARTIRLRDQQIPVPNTPIEDLLMPDREALAVQRHTAIADHISVLLDQAQMSLQVTYLGHDMVPRYALIELARLLDEAGLIDDTRIGADQ